AFHEICRQHWPCRSSAERGSELTARFPVLARIDVPVSENHVARNWPERISTAARAHPAFVIVVPAVVASIAGIGNGFAFDDIHVIVRNPRLHTLAAPWGLLVETYWRAEMGSMLYRPMTMVAFAIQWVIGAGSPLPFHVVSIGLYAALSAAVYQLAVLLMPRRAAFAATALFAVHPVHVEAVANVVGQSELWVELILVALV